MPTELEDLVGLLHSPQPAVVQIALDNLVGYSQANKEIFAYDNYEAIKDLKNLSKSEGKTMVEQATTCLANLCSDLKVRDLIVEDIDYLKFLVKSIVNITNSNADLMCILLTNLAKNDNIVKILDFKISHDKENNTFKSDKVMDCLMDCFVKGADRSLNKYANFDYLSYFFADISRFQQGRDYFITEQAYDEVVPITKLLVFTEKYDSKIRREGVASTIKNSLFDSTKHHELLTNPNINLLPYILLPIAGPEEIDEDYMFDLPEELQLLPSDKVRDPLKGLICIHLESLLLLCTTRPIREYLREKAVYAIVRELHKVESDSNVVELCDKLVQFLMRDEGEEDVEEIVNEESDDDDAIIEVL
ncbi:protein Hgh1p [[Candida] jaroonii]|uniref:Protein Hgh1p n=1 Tax=[Candida] jaroonii TaxID=467808 RepID=A0ACA9YBN6_9ASCO|nr:protein Hgh1p [[Candida] jaroonii]